MANEEMWDKLLKRVESLKTELKPTETNVRDAIILASHGLSVSFLSVALNRRRKARALKDVLIKSLQESGLSRKRIDEISNELTEYCDLIEKTK